MSSTRNAAGPCSTVRRSGDGTILKYLVAKGAKLETKDNRGFTPVDAAASALMSTKTPQNCCGS